MLTVIAALAVIFDRFERWSRARSALQALTLLAVLLTFFLALVACRATGVRCARRAALLHAPAGTGLRVKGLADAGWRERGDCSGLSCSVSHAGLTGRLRLHHAIIALLRPFVSKCSTNIKPFA